ncbi:MAG: MATE family efflux transporter, partial [Myxococcales bacterium]|nr:MATE family efflux transporter [Myxococcales bacterium]
PALGALGICDLLTALGSIISYGLSIATVALMSRRQGEGDEQGSRHVAWQSVLVMGALALLFLVIGVFGAETLMVDVVGAKGEVARLGTNYVRVGIGGSFTMFFLLHLTALPRALGSSKMPIAFLLGANVLNFFLSILMVYGPGKAPDVFSWGPPVAEALGIPRMELMGAIWSTVICRAVTLLPLIYLLIRRFGLFKREWRSRPDFRLMGRILDLGWPSSAQLVVRILAMLATQSLVNRAFTTAEDPTATTALGIVFRLETMALFMSLGWGSASQTFMGTNLGAGQSLRAKHSGYVTALYNALTMAALALIYWQAGESVVRFFDDSPVVVSQAMAYLRWVAPSYVLFGVGVVLGSAIQGAGATRFTLLIDGSVVGLIQLPLSILAVYVHGKTQISLWQVLVLTNVLFALVYVFAYRGGRYLHKQV